jgi:hypothetical protein
MLHEAFHIYRHPEGSQISLKGFFLPFRGTVSGDSRLDKVADLIPRDELDHHYASPFPKGFGAPAKPLRIWP